MKISCTNCYHSWENKKNDSDSYFCHKCGYDNKNKEFNLLKLKDWMKNNQKLVSEQYKNRLQQLAGLVKENAYIDANGQLQNLNYIPGTKEFIYSITYQELDRSQFADGEDISDYTDQGYDIEPTNSRLSFIIENAKNNYGIYEPSSSHVIAGCWWSSTQPKQNREFFEKGKEVYYSLHIKNQDGSDLTKEESEFITKLLNSSLRTYWDDNENKWQGIDL